MGEDEDVSGWKEHLMPRLIHEPHDFADSSHYREVNYMYPSKKNIISKYLDFSLLALHTAISRLQMAFPTVHLHSIPVALQCWLLSRRYTGSQIVVYSEGKRGYIPVSFTTESAVQSIECVLRICKGVRRILH